MSTSEAKPDPFFDHPILNLPYTAPVRHWERDAQGQPTQRILDDRRSADFITPIPRPRKRKGAPTQEVMVFDEGRRLWTKERQYNTTSRYRRQRGRWSSA